MLDKEKNNIIRKPVVAVLGGAAKGGKFAVIASLLPHINSLVLGGGLANTFLKAKGGKIGSSLWDADNLELAKSLLEQAASLGVKVFLPMDALTANEISPKSKPSLEGALALFDDKIIQDIGPRTIERFRNVILTAGTVIWNGPMGIYELPAFANGTREIAKTIAETKAISIICGEDTIKAAGQFAVLARMDYSAKESDAVLQLFSGEALPDITCLKKICS